ncbi:MAG TPA: hypothetical protein VK179_19565 [Bacteroidales bacterium]|nr:hypothetical protein [Bacteroidales bacterium]
MAGKDFSVVTKFILSSTGFSDGAAKVTKEAKQMQTGIQNANSSIKQSFSSLAGVTGGLTSEISGIGDAIGGGAKAFKSMIPAINGVKAALISTGIGAIVVALGVAFAALSSYLTGTKDGADKLNTVLGYAKGIFTAILNRVQLLGEAVALVFEGKFKQAGEKLKQAFSGGLLEEIKETAQQSMSFAQRENELKKQQNELIRKQADYEVQIAQLRLTAEDKSKSAEERQNAITQAIRLQKELSNAKNLIAKEEYEILTAKNALGNNSYEDDKKEAELYAKMVGTRKEEADRLKEMVTKQGELTAQLTVQRQEQERINELRSQPLLQKIESKSGKIEQPDFGKLPLINTEKIQEATGFMAELQEGMKALQEDSTKAGELLFTAFSSSMSQLTNVLGQGAQNFKKFGQQLKSAVKEIIGTLISQAVAAMVSSALKDWSTKVAFGYLVAPAMAAAAGGLAKTAFSSMLGSFANAGTVDTPFQIVGERGPERVQLPIGTKVSTAGQTRMMMNNAVGEITVRIEGTDLVGVLKNYDNMYNRYI